jgi:hypothetical protein
MLELTDFVLDADWRPVARDWAALLPGSTG